MLIDDLFELQRIDSTTDQLTHRRANLAERAAAEQASAELGRTTRRIVDLIARQRQLNDAIESAEETGGELTRNGRGCRVSCARSSRPVRPRR